ncbi:DMT family transporter [Vibrio sp. TH_r3]|uniref:DMT family transporter n=1 Tax=Vibrio sp. TH_r3 TaxID=3082084 RepID=UPI002952A9E6|nr:DMT family transporter [Vibrio sp. TH_r3]MDV7104880.1 DMT family transporter [Vibrio sp. TH_r3]
MDKVIHSVLNKPRSHSISPLTKGYLIMALVLLIWSGFALTTRAIGGSLLTIADVSLIRFFVPLVLLTPLIPSHFNEIKKIKISDILFIILGGVPFLFLAALGANNAPTAYVGTILAGTSPLFVALLSYVLYRQKISSKRAFTLSLILVGVVIMVKGHSGHIPDDMMVGVGYLFCAALVWAGYTIGLKRVELSCFSIAIVVSYLSFFITLGLVFSGIASSNFGVFSMEDALPFILIQGLGVGVLATIGFSYVVSQLGSARASIVGSISPGLTALLAVPIFNEALSAAIIFGLALTILGVLLSNRT